MFLVFADMAQRRLKADEIDALLASMEEEEDIDDPCEREEEEDEYIEDVGGAVGGPTASGYQPSDSEEEGDHPDDSDTLLEPLTIADDETAAQEALHGPHAPIEEPPVTPVEERSRRRRRGLLQPPRGTPIEKIEEEELRGKDGTAWKRDPKPELPRISSIRVEAGAPTVDVIDSSATRMSEFISLFLDDEMLASVVLYSNQRLERLRANYGRNYSVAFHDVDLLELKGMIGLLIMSGACKDNHVATKDMWDGMEGAPLYKSTMSERRFSLLLRILRFDDLTTRAERARSDKFAPMRSLWDKFVDKCRRNYGPGPHLTVDEQLVPFRGRCPFKVYIPSKPAK